MLMNNNSKYKGLSRFGPWLILPALLLAFFFGRTVSRSEHGGISSPVEENASESQSWTCSMHPQIILPTNDQKCPICFMDLIPLDGSLQEGLAPEDLALSEAGIALAGIETSVVQRRFVSQRIPLVGTIRYDEARLHHITARYGGRLDKLYVSTTGEKVRRGSKLADIYSPELYGAQVELRSAMTSSSAGRPGGKSLIRSARQRLLLLGFDEEQIDQIAKSDEQNSHLSITAPAAGVVVDKLAVEGMYVKTGSLLYSIADLSKLWVVLEAFESDLPWLKKGQNVPFTVRSQPGHDFTAVIDFIEPVLNKGTRAVEVRLLVDNSAGDLMPGMLVSAEVEVVLNEKGRPVDLSTVAVAPLVVPASAVLQAGPESMVYVRKTGEEGVFSGRKIKLGPKAGEYYLVLDGLEIGEDVVTRGNFKIDSALQILAQPSMMGLLSKQGQETGKVTESNGLVALSGPKGYRARLSDLLDRYIKLQTALAGDDGQSSRLAAFDLSVVLALIQETSFSLTVEEKMAWTKYYDPMNKSSQSIATSDSIESQRLDFQPLSDNLWSLLSEFGNPDSRIVRHINCPMAMDGEGANWLQFEKEVANPYYGSTMLRCGSEFESLAVGDVR